MTYEEKTQEEPMRKWLLEQCREIAERLPEGTRFADWLDDFDPSVFDEVDPVQAGDALYAMGSLNGAAFICDRTIFELLDAHGIDPAWIDLHLEGEAA